ncbi:SHOCT domain-containing protein [Mycolicibacterium hodleri]|uniref:SHOCT domain-containing protein n=1 Tax=Mycolicibacterium hodleri TaxID=49897 RepID=A0A502E5Z2_9MYCO|nr:SHOCT domain-containing protein [Mycolicibacterium hodleri]TPG33073.1 SHOCT domain-containing protein [Mycolicibacterium hodleri]
MSLLRSMSRVAVASSVHGRVQRRQRDRWATVAPTADTRPPAPVPAPQPPAEPAVDLLAQLERLGRLRDSGVLTEDEFTAQKARLLAG